MMDKARTQPDMHNLEVNSTTFIKLSDKQIAQGETAGTHNLQRLAQAISSNEQTPRVSPLEATDTFHRSTQVSAEHHRVHFNLDGDEDTVYAVGLVAYLVGDSDEGDIEAESWEIEGRNVFEFTIRSLEEYKRVFVHEWLKGGMS
ncbi:hypothetical protein GJ744_005221 [Endocarpon pusillum]|uniref:Uncharacterized protein n=1 Tax=Endocarpon pusillum TaxID=364733 RepID=A0A8H7A504_9EURO|nr:hypothetical protein GJ744_005221 [Endocarpon pusillum]